MLPAEVNPRRPEYRAATHNKEYQAFGGVYYPKLGDIFEALGDYKYVLSEVGERLDFERLLKRARTQLHPYDRIVVTDREWN